MIEIKDLVKTFKTGTVETRVLKGISLTVNDGEFLAIMGRSGAGKSTLIYQMSLLDEATSGEIRIDGKDVHHMSEKEKSSFRLYEFGFVFQEYALLPDLTAIENVVVPLLMENFSAKDAYAKSSEALTKVGLENRLHNLPGQLSGGEQQRVSIARAIAEKPRVLFADEPTANLDRESSATIIKTFKELHDEGQTIVMVTHEDEYGKAADRIIQIDDGMIQSIKVNH